MRSPRVNFATLSLLAIIRFYKRYVSAFMPVACRHLPTCSDYAYLAVEKYGFSLGILMAVKRLLRCRPFGTEGYDPVP
ncbi:membrane protein insertion efficiency factor YidD [Chloroflexi bacterium]|nr:membrane protein insertion efficiency factor YidD [Chloroflexota bacterium]